MLLLSDKIKLEVWGVRQLKSTPYGYQSTKKISQFSKNVQVKFLQHKCFLSDG